MKLFNIIYRVRKRTLLCTLGLLYLTALFSFGFIYWKIANESSGEFFVFQNDINMNTKIHAFKKQMRLDLNNREFNSTIRELISSEEYKRPAVKLGEEKTNSDRYVFVFDKPLGETWANYYYIMLQEKGITHIVIENAIEEKLNGKFSTYKLKVGFYTVNNQREDEKFQIHKKSDYGNFTKIDSKYLWINDYPIINAELFKYGYYFYPLNFYFINLMENSISFLDESPLILKGVAKGDFEYPLWNFMYFSAVTITTLGYGDILPNSTTVRILVMIETVFGVIIIGMFASCLFWNKK